MAMHLAALSILSSLRPTRLAFSVAVLLFAVTAVLLWRFHRRLRAAARTRAAEMHATAQQLRAVFEHTVDFLCLLQPDGRLIEANPQALRFAGTTLPQVAGRPFWETPWWRHSPRAQETCRRSLEVARRGERVRVQTTHTDRHGQVHVVDSTFTPIRDTAGRVVLVVSEGYDLNEQKEAEQALRRASEEWQRTFDTVPDLICLLDSQRRILRANRALCERLGKRPGELEGQPCTFLVHGKTTPPEGCPQQALLRDGREHSCEMEIPQLGGWFMVSASPLQDEHGREIGAVHVARDVSALHEAAAERARLESQLGQAQKMEAIGRLAGGVAHDFNNMLAVILGNAQLLKRRLASAGPPPPALADIERAAERSRDLIRQLLAFSRREPGEPRALDLNAAIANVRGVLVRLIGEDVDLRCEPEAGLWPARCDPAQLDRIVLNLAANARDALPSGGTLTIRTTNARLLSTPPGAQLPLRPGDYVLLEISDDGVGIEPALLPRIFEPFLTTKGEGLGTGLGLATVYGIVEQNGGSIAVESSPGKGTRFRIYLPRCREEEASAADTTAGSSQPPAAAVLLVEDDEHVRGVTAGLLDALGCSVLEADSAERALELAGGRERRIDLLLTDVVMPRMSGRELRDRIAALRPGLPVLYMSGYAQLGGRHVALEPGARFIQKPFGIDALAAELKAALGGGRDADAAAS